MTKKPLTDEVIALWHPDKNSGVDLSKLSGGSGKKVWWQCPQGHDFESAIRDVTGGHGCPYCSGSKVWSGFNDLSTTHPVLANEWNNELNGGLNPNQVSYGSKTKVWWTGSCGHNFVASVGSRAVSHRGCPYCSGQKILIGFNDLATTHPQFVTQWHPVKNADTTPQEFTAGSNKKVWWFGECGHEFIASIAEKIRSGDKGCPYCSGKSVLAGFNDLGSQFPELSKEWDPENDISVSEISAKSIKKVKWICSHGHHYDATVRSRTQNGTGCNYCTGRRTLPGLNDVFSTHPHLKEEWDEEKNKNLLPESLSRSSSTSVWWLCPTGLHSYLMPINSRTGKFSSGCNICSNRVYVKGHNDLTITCPELVDEWHPVLNGDMLPNGILKSHKERVWWLCANGHEWEISPASRVSSNPVTGCPVCQSKNFSSQPEKDLVDMLENKGLEVLTNRRDVINGMELDIYLPAFKVAIEYNGLYWHTEEMGKDRTYHYNKWLKTKEKGIQLIQIWEDEWLANPERIKNMLLHKLGLSQQEKVYARKTKVVLISKEEAEVFLQQNHIQGYASGSYYYGLQETAGKERMVAVLVLKKESGETLNIIRYATAFNVVGGFTKLISHTEKNLAFKRFITFSDHSISDGSLYRNNGFIVDKELAPDYRYLVKRQRLHKFGYRLKRFRTDPELLWQEGLTEKELAKLNGLSRIWDAGKTRWVKVVGN